MSDQIHAILGKLMIRCEGIGGKFGKDGNMNYQIIDQFKKEILNAGIAYYGEIIADGKLHRFHVDGDKPGTLNGAYILHLDGNPAGWFKHHKTGITGKWSANRQYKAPRKVNQAKIDKSKRDRLQEQQRLHKQAAFRAINTWKKAKPAINHPYLTKKRINPHCARVTSTNALIIPLCDESKNIVNLQLISPEGEKRFLKGGRKLGCFCWIGKPTDTVLIAEGFATAATLHGQTGYQVYIAFDAGNLEPVAKTVRSMLPDKKIIIAADNDESGIGEQKAKKAAISIGALVSMPPTIGHDWNDHYNDFGG